MNLHGIAGPIIAAVNPMLTASLQRNYGWTVQADRRRVAAYSDPVDVVAQVQAMSWKDLQQVDGLNLQGTKVSIYLYGAVAAAVRVSFQGGDLITIPGGNWSGVYLTHVVLEQWPDWVKIACTLQNQPVTTLPNGPALGNQP